VVQPFTGLPKDRHGVDGADCEDARERQRASPTTHQPLSTRANGKLPRRHEPRERVRHSHNKPDDERRLMERHGVHAEAEQRDE
jgi:hypothetical protein